MMKKTIKTLAKVAGLAVWTYYAYCIGRVWECNLIHNRQNDLLAVAAEQDLNEKYESDMFFGTTTLVCEKGEDLKLVC